MYLYRYTVYTAYNNRYIQVPGSVDEFTLLVPEQVTAMYQYVKRLIIFAGTHDKKYKRYTLPGTGTWYMYL